jgi:hypothetical protein
MFMFGLIVGVAIGSMIGSKDNSVSASIFNLNDNNMNKSHGHGDNDYLSHNLNDACKAQGNKAVSSSSSPSSSSLSSSTTTLSSERQTTTTTTATSAKVHRVHPLLSSLIYHYRTHSEPGMDNANEIRELLREEKWEDDMINSNFRNHSRSSLSPSSVHIHQPSLDTTTLSTSTSTSTSTANADVVSIVQSMNLNIAVVTFLVNRVQSPQFGVDIYTQLVRHTVPNMVKYCQIWGYPFYFLNDHLVGQGKHAFWGKMDILLHYLTTQIKLDWILYTDIDVLFTNNAIPLQALIQDCSDDHHFIVVLEPLSKSHVYTADKIGHLVRSGFFMVRNSPQSIDFLKSWQQMHSEYKDVHNPEQTALEDLVNSPEHRHLFCMHTSMAMHTYSTNWRKGMFSVHFPSPIYKAHVGRWVRSLDHKEDYLWNVVVGRAG